MLTVSLNNLQFEAYHGVYPEEKILGNSFEVDCSVDIPAPDHIIRHIEETVNYQKLYEIIKSQMEIATPLLETVSMNIGALIHEAFPEVITISVTIRKLRPPINGLKGSTSVTWKKHYSSI